MWHSANQSVTCFVGRRVLNKFTICSIYSFSLTRYYFKVRVLEQGLDPLTVQERDMVALAEAEG